MNSFFYFYYIARIWQGSVICHGTASCSIRKDILLSASITGNYHRESKWFFCLVT